MSFAAKIKDCGPVGFAGRTGKVLALGSNYALIGLDQGPPIRVYDGDYIIIYGNMSEQESHDRLLRFRNKMVLCADVWWKTCVATMKDMTTVCRIGDQWWMIITYRAFGPWKSRQEGYEASMDVLHQLTTELYTKKCLDVMEATFKP